jgi:hypothetical protein
MLPQEAFAFLVGSLQSRPSGYMMMAALETSPFDWSSNALLISSSL